MHPKSPLKAAPLRLPGQSLDLEFQNRLQDTVLTPMVIGAVLIILTGMEWLRWLFPSRAQPWLYTGIAVAYVVWAAMRFHRRHWPELKALRLGRDGERAIGQFLENLRADGAQVFHDVQGESFNLDHVVVSPRGIFTIETKTRSKPTPNATVTFDGTQLRVAGYAPDRDPIIQAQAQARWLRDALQESTGRTWQIKPVIVFPGWFVEDTATANAKKVGVWLLNPRVLPAFIEHKAVRLAPEEVKLASYHLARMVRSSNV